MELDKIISGIFLVAAFMLANPNNFLLPKLEISYIVAGLCMGMVVGAFAMVKSYMLISGSVKKTQDYMEKTATFHTQARLLDKIYTNMRIRLMKSFGKGTVLLHNLTELVTRGSGALSGLVFVLLAYFGMEYDVLVFVGVWIILCTIFVTLLFKFSGVIGFAAQVISLAPAMPFTDYFKEIRGLLVKTGALSLIIWILQTIEMQFFINAFSSPLGFFHMFLLFALISVFSLMPFTAGGMGVMEFVAVLVLPVFGISAAVAFTAMLCWELAQILSTSFFTWFFQKQHFAKYR